MTKLFEHLPRRIYTPNKTELHTLLQLEKALGASSPNLYIKRDDTLGLAFGGNKTRKLEFLVGDAISQGCDTLITCGAIQSNHCRLTLSAAKKEGLDCHLLLEERVPNTYKKEASGNNFLYHLMGAATIQIHKKGADLPNEMVALAEKLKSEGKKPYIIPSGGSNAIGTSGYVNCLIELLEQCGDQKVVPTLIVCTSGSAGTHAGLVAGLKLLNYDVPVIGFSISREAEEQQQIVSNLANETLSLLNSSERVHLDDIIVNDDYVGDGYSIPTPEMKTAVSLMAKKEGILLDPVYTGKAFAGLLGLVKEGFFDKEDNIIFIHTGGAPALFASTDLWL